MHHSNVVGMEGHPPRRVKIVMPRHEGRDGGRCGIDHRIVATRLVVSDTFDDDASSTNVESIRFVPRTDRL